jgi:hypothetical protein
MKNYIYKGYWYMGTTQDKKTAERGKNLKSAKKE